MVVLGSFVETTLCLNHCRFKTCQSLCSALGAVLFRQVQGDGGMWQVAHQPSLTSLFASDILNSQGLLPSLPRGLILCSFMRFPSWPSVQSC